MKKAIVALVVLFAAAQLVPVSRENPPVEEAVPAPAEVRAILERSCYDCHSHEVRWPWYARVAPASWLVAWDVGEAREHLNFSTWNRYDAEKRLDHLEELWEEVDEGKMPLWYYLPLHPEARLSDADRAALRAWVASTGAPVAGGGDHEH
jgi:cytochrome c551/c552